MNPRPPASSSGPPPHPAAPQPPDPAFKTDLVNNIPIHQSAQPAAPIKEDEDIDKLMQDVGRQLKADDKKPTKHHLFSKKKTKVPNFQAAPISRHQPQSGAVQSHQPPHPQAQQSSTNHPASPKLQAQPKAKSNAPVMVIITTLIVTSMLVAAALAAAK